jgi:SPP1 family predicted phage head-tail adaptor
MSLKGLNIGSLDIRITIQDFTTTTDEETNAPIKTWSTLKTVWAKRLKKWSNEQFEGKQPVANTSERFMIRYTTGINEKMRLIDGDSTYEIMGIEQGADRKTILILTVERRDNA